MKTCPEIPEVDEESMSSKNSSEIIRTQKRKPPNPYRVLANKKTTKIPNYDFEKWDFNGVNFRNNAFKENTVINQKQDSILEQNKTLTKILSDTRLCLFEKKPNYGQKHKKTLIPFDVFTKYNCSKKLEYNKSSTSRSNEALNDKEIKKITLKSTFKCEKSKFELFLDRPKNLLGSRRFLVDFQRKESLILSEIRQNLSYWKKRFKNILSNIQNGSFPAIFGSENKRQKDLF